MSPYQKKQQTKQRKNFFRQWHRRIGFTAALFLFNLAVTGILLNHYEDLNLHQKYITSDWIIKWYGVKAPENVFCVPSDINRTSICQLGEKIYYGDQLLVDETSPLVGMLKQDSLLYLSTSSAIYIYNSAMELVEISSSDSGLPPSIHQLLSLKSEISSADQAIAAISNDQFFLLNQDDMTWTKSKLYNINNQVLNIIDKKSLVSLSGEQANKLKGLYLDRQITQLKLVQDLHSGSILFVPGKYLTDLIGLVIILLSITGFIAWQRRKEFPDV